LSVKTVPISQLQKIKYPVRRKLFMKRNNPGSFVPAGTVWIKYDIPYALNIMVADISKAP
jgi:hypothetical protein